MIAYDLQCSQGHQFEGWFEDSRAFERQNEQGLIACPVCDDTAILKVPSTFAIKATSGTIPLKPDGQTDMAALGKQIVDYVENNFDNVGADFAEEALKMHYGVSEPRNIRGVSTPQEEETLKSQGINFFKFPVPVKAEDGGQSSED
jgi:hypothetical protein